VKKSDLDKQELREVFRECAGCMCGTAGGMALGHIGCIATPLLMAAARIVTAGAAPVLAIAFGVAATAGGLYGWHRLRGHKATRFEKRLVVGGAVIGLALSSAFHLTAHRGHAPVKDAPANDAGITICAPPARVDTVTQDVAQFRYFK
jgi:hypothetical protein